MIVDTIRKLVRPSVAIALVGTVVYLAITGKIEPEKVLYLATIVITFYFAERAAKKPE